VLTLLARSSLPFRSGRGHLDELLAGAAQKPLQNHAAAAACVKVLFSSEEAPKNAQKKHLPIC